MKDEKWISALEDDVYCIYEEHVDLTQSNKYNRQKDEVKQVIQQIETDDTTQLFLRESFHNYYGPKPSLYRHKTTYKQVAPDGSLLNEVHDRSNSLELEEQKDTPKLHSTLLIKKRSLSVPAQLPGDIAATKENGSAPLSPVARKAGLFKLARGRTKSLKNFFGKGSSTSSHAPQESLTPLELDKEEEEDLELRQELLNKFYKASEELDEVWLAVNNLR